MPCLSIPSPDVQLDLEKSCADTKGSELHACGVANGYAQLAQTPLSTTTHDEVDGVLPSLSPSLPPSPPTPSPGFLNSICAVQEGRGLSGEEGRTDEAECDATYHVDESQAGGSLTEIHEKSNSRAGDLGLGARLASARPSRGGGDGLVDSVLYSNTPPTALYILGRRVPHECYSAFRMSAGVGTATSLLRLSNEMSGQARNHEEYACTIS